MSDSSTELSGAARLNALRKLRLLDSPAEDGFDRLAKLTARVIDVPICLVSLVDDRRQFFKAAVGLAGPVGEARETPLTHSFCQHVVTSDAPLMVSDAPAHPQVCDNLAIRDLGVMAYLGIPIHSPEGFVLGSFCAIDTKPRAWSVRDVDLIREFAGLVEVEIGLRAASIDRELSFARQKAVLDGTVFSVIATTPEGVIDLFNPAAECMLGYTAAELVGRQTPAVIHLAEEVAARGVQLTKELGRDIQPGFEVFVAKAQLGEPEEREWTYVRKDGTRLPVLLSVTALRSANGKIEGFLGIAQDITARKRTESVLQATRTRLEKTFSALSEGLVLQDAQGAILDCNAAAERILGLSRDQMAGLSSLDPKWRCVREDGRAFPGAEHPAMVTLGTGISLRDVVMGIHKSDGSFSWIEINTELIGAAGDGDRQVVCTFRDITARRAAESAVRASDGRFRLLAQHAPVGIFRTDAQGGCEWVNERWSQLTGLPLSEALGEGWSRAVHPADRESIYTEWKAFSRGQREFQLEYRFAHPDGRIVWVAGSAVVIRDATGEITGYLGTVNDITARKDLETSLALARDQALEASRLKSEFLAMMSHEIRTPMNAVIGMAGLLADTPMSAAQDDMVRTMLGGAENLLTIINDILDFSRIEAGKMRLDEADFDFRRTVEETVALLASRAHQKGLEITCDFRSDSASVLLGDSGRVRQILTNLIGNAIKFTDAGQVDVVVNSVAEKRDRTRLRMSVRDTGVGIRPEAQGKLFQPFTQADGSMTRRFGGTGLGLAITRQLVELMGGEIGFESEPGVGSLFWVEIEFARRGEAKPAPTIAAAAGQRILVVDDNETNRRILVGQLERGGWQVRAVADGASALACLRDPALGPWHLILVDWKMPGMTGLELAIEIRTVPVWGGLPLVMLSSTEALMDIGATTAAGFAAFLTKPVTAFQLNRCVSRVIAAAPTVLATVKKMGPASTSRRTLSGRKLLLVEDNLANQRVAALLLAKFGYEVEIAANGELGLAQLRGKDFDAVLMDCQMPILNGYDATRRIRSGQLPGVNAKVPIIALTAYARAEDRARCLDAGMDDYVTKPIRAGELRAALERCGLDVQGIPSSPPPEQPTPGGQVFDERVFAATQAMRGAEGEPLLPQLLRLHLNEETGRLEVMDRLLAKRQGGLLGDQAHSFAGNAASFGAFEVREMALALEIVARAEDWPVVSARLEDLREAGRRLRTEVAKLNLLA